MANKVLRILLAGEGGQGVQAIAMALARAADLEGKKVTYLPNFGVEQRGGVSLAFVQISKEEIAFPKFQEADIAVILAERAIPRIEEYLKSNPKIMFDNSIVSEKKLEKFKVEKIAIPATVMAKDKLIPRVFNMIILGSLATEIGLKSKNIKKVVLEIFQDKIKKRAELKHFNVAAIELGEKTIKKLKS